MQLLNSQCPYCNETVQTAADQLHEPVVCPACHKPFEVRIPKADVTSVQEVKEKQAIDATSASRPSERTLRTIHPAVLRRHLLGSLILILILAASSFGLWWASNRQVEDLSQQLALWGSVAGFVGVLLTLGWWYLNSIATTLTITDNRTMLRKGLLRKETSEVQHDDVRNIQIDQSMWHRILGIGILGISSSGQDDLEIVVQGVPDPAGIAEVIREHQM